MENYGTEIKCGRCHYFSINADSAWGHCAAPVPKWVTEHLRSDQTLGEKSYRGRAAHDARKCELWCARDREGLSRDGSLLAL